MILKQNVTDAFEAFFMFLERCLPCCLSHVGVLCGLRNKALARYDFRCSLIRPSPLIMGSRGEELLLWVILA